GLAIGAGAVRWSLRPSEAGELVVRAAGRELPLRLADARQIEVAPYRTGFRTGLKIRLSGWKPPGLAPLGLALVLTVGLEGADEELVFEAAAEEQGAAVRRLDWPQALDASGVDLSVLPAGRGMLLPRDWPQEFDPIRPPRAAGAPPDLSEIQSHV